MHKCINNSIGNVYHLEQFVSEFFPYSQKQLGFDQPVEIRFESDPDNAGVMLGKTAYYDPAATPRTVVAILQERKIQALVMHKKIHIYGKWNEKRILKEI